MALSIIVRYFYLNGPLSWKFMHEIVAWQQIAIWDQTVPGIKELRKRDPLFMEKMGVCLLFAHLLPTFLKHCQEFCLKYDLSWNMFYQTLKNLLFVCSS